VTLTPYLVSLCENVVALQAAQGIRSYPPPPPQRDRDTLPRHELRVARANHFAEDPLYFLAIGHDEVPAITSVEWQQAFWPGVKPGVAKSRWTEMMKFVTRVINQTYGGGGADDGAERGDTKNSVFPLIRHEGTRDATTDSYHTGTKAPRFRRSIPVYVLPFVARMKGLQEEFPNVWTELDAYKEQLRAFCEEHPMLGHFGDAFQQLRANMRMVMKGVQSNAATLELAVNQNLRASSASIKQRRGDRHLLEQLRRDVEQQRQENDKLKRRVVELEGGQSSRKRAKRD